MEHARLLGAALVGIVVATTTVHADEPIVRKELYTAQLGGRSIGKVDVKQIDFKPLQKTPLHKHPCPVVSYIASGTVYFQLQGQRAQTLHAGQVVYEPADAVVEHFDNPSKTEGLTFIPYYLLQGNETSLIETLPAK